MASYVIGIPSVPKVVTPRRPGSEDQQFTVEIRVRKIDEQDKLDKKRKNSNFKIVDAVREDVISVSGLDDADGKAIDSSKDVINALMNDPFALNGIIRAWNEVQRGVPEAEAKN